MDKKQLRSRDDNLRNNSPDIEIVDVQMPDKYPGKRRRSRSRSLSSISTLSSASSRSRYLCRSRHKSRVSNHSHRQRRWSQSRSRSPYQYRRRHRSPSYRHYSPNYDRNRSPDRRWNHNRNRSPDSHKYKEIDRYGRSRDRYDNKDRFSRGKAEEKSPPREMGDSERQRWDNFREELKKIESLKLEKLKFHEKNPEKHPQYPEEWKSFWNRRYNELQRSGIDPTKHDFKPEWISFWTKRMKELYEEDLGKSKEELKNKFGLPEDLQPEKAAPWKNNSRRRSPGLIDISPPTPDKKDVINNIKSTWKAFTGSDIKDAPKRPLSPWEEETHPSVRKESRKLSPRSRSQSPNITDKILEEMPQRKTRTSSLIFVLRKLTVLEQQLGSLAPKVFELMSQSLALEKVNEDASLDLLLEIENATFLETAREKLIALLCAGVVPRNFVNTARSAIKHIDIALYLASKRERSMPSSYISGAGPYASSTATLAPRDPVVVPGVGQVDKVAIAQQIAVALVEQGKTNVTEAELEQLINAVVGMAEASANSAQPITTANFLQHLQSVQNAATSTQLSSNTFPTAQAVTPVNDAMTPVPVSDTQPAVQPNQQPFGALKLLQSAYNETSKQEQDSPKPIITENTESKTLSVSDEELASTLASFNSTSKEEQPRFIQKLKISNPEMYKRLGPFISSHDLVVSEPAKRSPIIIPISKEKSEQKIKPLSSGRLSPFSLRSGGANPSLTGDIEIEENVIKPKSNIELLTKPQALESDNKSLSKLDVSDDDDDDDYSYEDVYKAAQETLRQKQLIESAKCPKSPTTLDEDVTVIGENDDKEELQSADIKQPPVDINSSFEHTFPSQNILQTKVQQPGPSVSQPSVQYINPSFEPLLPLCAQQPVQTSTQHNYQPKFQQDLQTLPKQVYQPVIHAGGQQSYQSYDRFSEIPSQAVKSNPYQAPNVSNYQDKMQKRPQPYASSTLQYNSNTLENYQGTEYSNVSSYLKSRTDSYDKNKPYSSDPLHSSETYSSAQRDPYASYNTAYVSQESYSDQYNRYRDNSYNRYGDDNYARGSYDQVSSQKGYPSSSSRYRDQNYPQY